MTRLLLLINCMLISISILFANDVQIANVTLLNRNLASHSIDIQFDISWQNSWRIDTAPNNYDAIWIFVKFRDSSNEWKHATISNQTNDHTPADGTQIESVADGKGVFLSRSEAGSGTFISEGNRIRWNYGVDGLSDADAVGLKLNAVEMVYIPEGSFNAGSDTTHAGDVNPLFVVEEESAHPFSVSTELVSNIKSEGTGISDSQDDDVLKAINGYTGIGIDGDDGLDTNNDGIIDNSSFPTGINGFYIMKYELSQIQYVEFLNVLTRVQQNSRTAVQTSNYYALSGSLSITNRSAIKVPTDPASGVITFGCDLDTDGNFNESEDGSAIACNFLSWPDVAAYLDWAALRPMTELEFTKASRGPNSVIAGEFVWGSAAGDAPPFSGLSAVGSESEIPNTAAANITAAGATTGPTRTGMYARTSTNRTQAGSGYFGVLDLAGNLWELVISLGNSSGRAYIPNNGDGQLSAAGNADVAGWPSSTITVKLGKRGGPYVGSVNEARIENRNYSNRSFYVGQRREFDGCRGVRTAP